MCGCFVFCRLFIVRCVLLLAIIVVCLYVAVTIFQPMTVPAHHKIKRSPMEVISQRIADYHLEQQKPKELEKKQQVQEKQEVQETTELPAVEDVQEEVQELPAGEDNSTKQESSRLCDCVPNDGTTELQQLKHFWNIHIGASEEDSLTVDKIAMLVNQSDLYDIMAKKKPTTDITQYKYILSDVTKIKNVHGHILLKFAISERYAGSITHGGATFKIMVYGTYTKSSCSYTDTFNGEYKICCVLRESKNTIDVYLMNVNYLSYQLHDSHHLLLQTINVDGEKPVVKSNGKLATPVLDRQSSECFFDDDFWMQTPGSGWWSHVEHDTMQTYMTKEEVDSCLSTKYQSSMSFLGDGNIRMLFNYIHAGIRGYYSDIKIDEHLIVATNDTYLKSTYVHVLTEQLDKIYDKTQKVIDNSLERTVVDKKLMVLNSGTWDLNYRDSANFMVDFSELLDVLIRLKRQGAYEIIWQNLPTIPHGAPQEIHARNINSYIIGAINAWIKPKLLFLDIPVIDYWRFAYPLEDSDSTCGLRYLCQTDGVFSGYIGTEAAQAILRKACL